MGAGPAAEEAAHLLREHPGDPVRLVPKGKRESAASCKARLIGSSFSERILAWGSTKLYRAELFQNPKLTASYE